MPNGVDPWQTAADPWGGVGGGGGGGGGAAASQEQERPPFAASDSAEAVWTDAWKPSEKYLLSFQGSEVVVKCPKGTWTEKGTVEGNIVRIWRLEGTLEHDKSAIVWSNGSRWDKEQASGGSAPSNSTARDDAPKDAKKEDFSWGNFESGPKERGAPTTPWASWGGGGGGAATAADSWGAAQKGQAPAAAGSWGATGDDDREHINKMRWRDFSAAQQWYKEKNILPGPSVQDESVLWGETGGRAQVGGGADFSLYDAVECNITGPKSEGVPVVSSFDQLFADFADSIPPELRESIRRCGFVRPTPVQKFAIPVGLAGRDIMCCAQTGSGKTAAFLVPMLASMIKWGRGTGALTVPYEGPCKPDTLILCPTRELCLQIFEDALRFCSQTNFRVVRVYGQESVKNQIFEIAKGADVCVATPGRLWDFVSSGIVSLTELNCLVFDEADRMLEMGDMDKCVRPLVENFGMPCKENRQTMMFSATFPDAIQKLAGDFLYEHLFVAVGAIGSASCTVTQVVIKVAPEEKYQSLIRLIDDWAARKKPGDRMLVFTNSKAQAKGLDEKLWDEKVANTGALHGDLTQIEREANLVRFREGQIDVMVATDLASRGLDISGVSHVVNYDLPFEISVYVQRIGRTGRIGHRGTAITFLAVDAAGKFHDRPEMLKELPGIMENAPNSEVPAYLAEKARELQGAASWETRETYDDQTDARARWGTWEDAKKSAAVPDWGSDGWKAKSADATAEHANGTVGGAAAAGDWGAVQGSTSGYQ